MKRTLLLFSIIVIISAGWSIGWYYVADKVETVIADGKDKLFRRGQAVDCEDQTLAGFPFRISLTCSTSGFRDAGSGFSIDAGALRSASQIYQPGKAVVEVDGPAILHLPVGQAFDMDWKSLRASVAAGLSGPDRFSVVGEDFSLKPRDRRYDAFDAGEIQLHSRKAETNDVDLAMKSTKVISSQNRWPTFDLAANLRINNAFDELLRKPDILQLAKRRGLEGNLNQLRYSLAEGGQVTLTGPYSVTKDGVLSGKFEIEALQLTRLVAALERVLPENRELLRQIASAASLLDGGNGAGRIKFGVSVRDGSASIGLIPIGRIPNLY